MFFDFFHCFRCFHALCFHFFSFLFLFSLLLIIKFFLISFHFFSFCALLKKNITNPDPTCNLIHCLVFSESCRFWPVKCPSNFAPPNSAGILGSLPAEAPKCLAPRRSADRGCRDAYLPAARFLQVLIPSPHYETPPKF